MIDKSSARKKYSELRSNLSHEEIAEKSLQIANQVLKLPIWDYSYYHLFLSIESKKEVQTEFILHILQGKDKSVVVSKSNFETNEMDNFLLQENTALKVSKYGIPEPVSGIAIDAKLIDVVFVPLLAFDLSGNRVGYGKGFYDRFLGTCRTDAVFIGLSFFEAETRIEATEDDVPLDFCVTPEKIYSF